MAPVIGIDLGTTNSCAVVYRNNLTEVIPLGEQKERTLPSSVYYDKTIKVGRDADKKAQIKPANCIFDTKRMIGQKFSDPFIQNCRPMWPFIVKADANDNCLIEVTPIKNDPAIELTPQQVSAEILKQIKADAEDYLKEPVENIVITVPAHFSDAQRLGTQEAAKIAGLNVLEIINEPTAAALAFSHQQEHQNRTVLVYDLGGGTFDVSLVKFTKGIGEVVAKKGDNMLGGRDFDNNLAEFIMKKVLGDNYDEDQQVVDKAQRRQLRRLKTKAKETKEMLSQKDKEECIIDEFMDGKDISLEIIREDFDNLNVNLYQKTINVVDEMLKDANVDKTGIDDVVLIGGSTRIPKIRQMLSDYFDGRQLSQGVNPDEAVAMGAALQGAMLEGNYGEQHRIADITPYSYGIKVANGRMSVIMPKGTKIPAEETKTNYSTSKDGQPEIKIQIFQGEDEKTDNNQMLGEFVVSGIEPKPAGSVDITIKFEVDQNSMLSVTAIDELNKNSNNLQCQLTMA